MPLQLSGSLQISGSVTAETIVLSSTASFAGTASWAEYVVNGGGGGFPYTGSAAISGSLILDGPLSQFSDQVSSKIVPVAAYSFTSESISYVNYSSSGLEQVWNYSTFNDAFEIALPFTHSFLGKDYTSIYFSSNQYFTLGEAAYVTSEINAKNPALPGYQIAAVGNDYNFELWTGSIDSGQTFQIYVVASDTPYYPGNTNRAYTFRIVSGSNEVELHFERMSVGQANEPDSSGVTDGESFTYKLDLSPNIVTANEYAFKIVPQQLNTPTATLNVSGSVYVRDTLYGTSSWAQNSSAPIAYDKDALTLYSVDRINPISPSNGTSVFLGYNSGDNSQTGHTVAVGVDAGKNSNSSYSTFLGWKAGYGSNAYGSIFIGAQAGYQASNFGSNEGSIGIGSLAFGSSTAKNSIAIGNSVARQMGYLCQDNIFMGTDTAFRLSKTSGSIMIGERVGYACVSSSFSVILGYQAGYNPFGATYNPLEQSIGENNIIIGTNISLDLGRRDSINIGGLIFGTGSHFDSTYYDGNSAVNVFSGSANGRIGINQPNPQYSLDVSGSIGLTDLFVLASKDVLPTSNVPSGSIMTSGSNADFKPYFWNGATWTSLI